MQTDLIVHVTHYSAYLRVCCRLRILGKPRQGLEQQSGYYCRRQALAKRHRSHVTNLLPGALPWRCRPIPQK